MLAPQVSLDRRSLNHGIKSGFPEALEIPVFCVLSGHLKKGPCYTTRCHVVEPL